MDWRTGTGNTISPPPPLEATKIEDDVNGAGGCGWVLGEKHLKITADGGGQACMGKTGVGPGAPLRGGVPDPCSAMGEKSKGGRPPPYHL